MNRLSMNSVQWQMPSTELRYRST